MSGGNWEHGTLRAFVMEQIKYRPVSETLLANKTLVVKHPPLQFLNPSGADRDVTLPAEADSEGLMFMIVSMADSLENLTIKNDSAATVGIIGQNEVGILVCNGTTWKSMITGNTASVAAVDVTLADAGGNYAAATVEAAFTELASVADAEGASIIGIEDDGSFTAKIDVEEALQELYQHLFSVQSYLGMPLNSFREATNFDVGNIAANGGILASDTTPILDAINAATDGCQRMLWASSNVDQVVVSLPLPPDLDPAKDVVLHSRIVSGGTTDAVGFTVDTFFNEGDTKVIDTTATNQTTTYDEVVATIAAADIPAGAQTITIGLTPIAHGTDTMACTAVWLEYSKALLTS
jgi:hypothetical protein